MMGKIGCRMNAKIALFFFITVVTVFFAGTMAGHAYPSSLTITIVSQTLVDLNWNSDLGDGYVIKIERRTNSGEFTLIDTLGSSATSYSDYFVSANNIYTYRLVSYNAERNLSVYSNEVSCTTSDVASPNSLDVIAVSSSQIDLTWSYGNHKRYGTVLERKTGTDGAWSVIATLSSGVTRYTDKNLTANTQYFYKARAISSPYVYSQRYPNSTDGNGAYTLLTAPTNLTANMYYPTQIDLNWTDNSDETEFVIERKSENQGYVQIATVFQNMTTWSDTSFLQNARYTYRVKATTATNTSDYSNETTVTSTVFSPPTNLAAKTLSNTEAELKWTDNTSSESGFEIWRKINEQGTWERHASVGRNTRTYTDIGLSPDNQYYYKVRGYVQSGNIFSPFTNEVYARTVIPTAPGNLDYTAVSDSQIGLYWQDNSNDESGFVVEKKTGEDGDWIETASLLPDTTSYTAMELAPNISYYFRIKVVNYGYNSSSYSNVIKVGTGLPGAPSSLAIESISPVRLFLKWTDNSVNEAGFKIERCKAGESYIEVARIGENITGYKDGGLEPGTLYYYKIRAYNKNGSSDYCFGVYETMKGLVTFNDIQDIAWAKAAIEDLASRDIIKGKDASTFAPWDHITRAEFVSLLVRALKLNKTPVGAFSDVNAAHWAYKELMTARTLGIITGDKTNNFYPDLPIKREDMAVFVSNALRVVERPLPAHNTSILYKYSDVNFISPYAMASLASLVGENIISGKSETTINPDDGANRAEAAVLLQKVIDR